MTTTAGSVKRSSLGVTGNCSGGSSSDEEEGEGLLDNAEFVRNRGERSTVLVRRFFRNNQKVFTWNIPFFSSSVWSKVDMTFVIFVFL